MPLAPIPFVPRTKFRPPRLPDDVLFRARLLERLDRDAALTLIIAPAGYGKTTLAGTWLAHMQPPRRLDFARQRRQHAGGLCAQICHGGS